MTERFHLFSFLQGQNFQCVQNKHSPRTHPLSFSTHPPTHSTQLFWYKGANTAAVQHHCSESRPAGLRHGAVHENSVPVLSTRHDSWSACVSNNLFYNLLNGHHIQKLIKGNCICCNISKDIFANFLKKAQQHAVQSNWNAA